MQEEFPNIETVLVRIIRVSSESAKGAPLIDRESGEKQKAVAYVLPWEEQWLGEHGTTRYYLLSQIPSDLQAGDKRWCKIIRQSIRTKPAVKPNAIYPRDGSRKEHWDYSIAEWDVDREPQQEGTTPQPVAQQPVAQQPVSTQYKSKEDVEHDKQIKIMRQTALKCASTIVQPYVNTRETKNIVDDIYDLTVMAMETADLLFDYIVTGETPKSKVQKQAQEAQDLGDSNDIDEEWN
jgi:hypothetical protein